MSEIVGEWTAAAEHWLEKALDDLRSGVDAIPATDAALACLRTDVGEQNADQDLLGHPAEPTCTCSPGLVTQGGFTSTCPACGNWAS